MDLSGKNITLAVTGGIAAYKACELVRLFTRAGARVRVAMTEAATRFVAPLSFEALSGGPVHVDQFSGGMPHLALGRGCDLLVVAPATADILAKAACGIADDLVSSVILARTCPVAFAPAMNSAMWSNPATQRNVRTLTADGAAILGPAAGDLACGVSGPGRMLEPADILEECIALLAPKPLLGRKVLVTAGPTYEAIDPVRAITNRSSGKQGYAIARAARLAGADVTLVSGPVALSAPRGIKRICVESAREMHEATLERAPLCDAFIAVAAVADWGVANPSADKIKKTEGAPQIAFTRNPDILAEVCALSRRPAVCVGFAAETRDILGYAKEKLLSKGADMIVANAADRAIQADDNEVIFVTRDGADAFGPAAKIEIAEEIIQRVARLATQGTQQ
ncbi:MAG TPA: bifunctional phosphopantothenoylcysteine decarboxylase/phosphopantothenate--cysteine ligase CoaBC [Sutterella sp.]|nr:bifunctional phosphopantothenoylcysteine decarboxylase/phosphopantothenate--cysteine ligase CoaBC [Sutterella sp.]